MRLHPAADPHQQGHHQKADDEAPRRMPERVEPWLYKARQECADQVDQRRHDLERACRAAAGPQFLDQRQRREIERGKYRHEVDDPAPPHPVPHRPLTRRARRRMRVDGKGRVWHDAARMRHDIVDLRKYDRGIAVIALCDAVEDGFVDFGRRPRNRFVTQFLPHLFFRILLVRPKALDTVEVLFEGQLVRRQPVQIAQVAWPVAIIAGEAVPRVVELVVRIDQLSQQIGLLFQVLQAIDMRARHHPLQRDVGKPVLRIATPDVRMHADEPHLADAFLVDCRQRRVCIRRLGFPAPHRPAEACRRSEHSARPRAPA